MDDDGTRRERREEFLTARQLAELLQVSESTVRRLAREGRIPSIRLTPRLTRYSLRAVLGALDGSAAKRARSHRPKGEAQPPQDDSQLSFEDLLQDATH